MKNLEKIDFMLTFLPNYAILHLSIIFIVPYQHLKNHNFSSKFQGGIFMNPNTIGTKEITKAFSELLMIRSTKNIRFYLKNNQIYMESVEFDYKPAPQEVRQQFAEKLDAFLWELIEKIHFIDFSFEYHEIGNLENNFTDNLARILRQLPELPIAENYSFFSKTSLRVTEHGKDKNGNHKLQVTASDNIKEKLASK